MTRSESEHDLRFNITWSQFYHWIPPTVHLGDSSSEMKHRAHIRFQLRLELKKTPATYNAYTPRATAALSS